MMPTCNDICKSLWCHRVGHRCETKFMPAAEGTACGLSMWCRQGQCVKLGELGPRPIHGQWSAWSKWSECSRTCGGGVKFQERHCSNPKPQYGGKYCPGSSRIYKLCNINPCPENSWISVPNSVQSITTSPSVDGCTVGNPTQKLKRKIDVNSTARRRTLSFSLPCLAR